MLFGSGENMMFSARCVPGLKQDRIRVVFETGKGMKRMRPRKQRRKRAGKEEDRLCFFPTKDEIGNERSNIEREMGTHLVKREKGKGKREKGSKGKRDK